MRDSVYEVVSAISRYCRVPEGLRLDVEEWPDRQMISMLLVGPDWPRDRHRAYRQLNIEELAQLSHKSYDGTELIDRIRQEVEYLVRQYQGPEIRQFRFRKKSPKHLRKVEARAGA